MMLEMTATVEPSPRTLIIGVGDVRRSDDGVGSVVAERLLVAGLPEGVTVTEGAAGGLDLVIEMEDFDRVIIIGAFDTGAAPGTVTVFTPDDLDAGTVVVADSPRRVSLVDVLELATMAGVAPEAHIVAVQPNMIAPGYELTEEVEGAVEEACEAVRGIVRGE
jgi:hydrogenase maturation protease